MALPKRSPVGDPQPPEKYLRSGQVAVLMGVSVKTVTRWAQEHELPFLRTLGGHRRYRESDVLKLLEESTFRPTQDTRRLQT